jgi:hypothetical protein
MEAILWFICECSVYNNLFVIKQGAW